MSKVLLQSLDCNDQCSNILDGKIISGEKAISIRSKYIAGTNYSFTM